MPKKIFILSLPRSGSTMLQKIIETDKKIFSVGEGWILLGLFGLNDDFGLSVYGSHALKKALNKFSKDANYSKWISESADNYYKSLSKDKIILDKTPRYFMIIDKIISDLSSKKVILLARNPYNIVSSYQETFSKYKWVLKLPIYKQDLKNGFSTLSRNFRSDVIEIRYEDIIDNPELSIGRLSNELELNGIDYKKTIFTKEKGELGDPKIGKYDKITKLKNSIELSIYLWILFNKRDLHINTFCKKYNYRNIPDIYVNWTTPFRLITWPFLNILRFINAKAIIWGIKKNEFLR